MTKKHFTLITLFLMFFLGILACNGQNNRPQTDPSSSLRGSSSYTAYDAHSMLWARADDKRQMVWVGSGGDAANRLVSNASTADRPDWILCTQGTVAGLAGRGDRVVIIGTVYISDEVILPVFRKPRRPLAGSRSMFIPRTSIEFAFDRLLNREGITRDQIRIPKAENVNFQTIESLLSKPVEDEGALDFGLLVEPFITNVVAGHEDRYEIGNGGLYEVHYSIVVRESDLKANRPAFVELLRQLLEVDNKLKSFPDDDSFYSEVWGRMAQGQPDKLPRMLTYRRERARLQLQPTVLRQHLFEELQYLTGKYPDKLKMPADVDSFIDPSLLLEVAPDRVSN